MTGNEPQAEPDHIYNWRRLDDRITTSGQPTEPQLAAIRDLGVRHIVNLGLHTHEKALPDEAGSVAELGMAYVHIPVDFQNPTTVDFERFVETMTALEDSPVHVHCIANYRVSAFLYRYRRDVLGMDEARARQDMEAVWKPEGVWADFIAAGRWTHDDSPNRPAAALIRPRLPSIPSGDGLELSAPLPAQPGVGEHPGDLAAYADPGRRL